ncbi:MAG: hypothetical protein Faunusvirus7_15 [Faunusvirus sp.]|jgi:hypothetical protein|uniref:BTB domain-containing protein n=1 Tax=Faunusvirus sp. TaxID=2487766 RepID=A0A3G4ZWI5_9VIRU|nr:MAG: hypothetical protein Faunusvirus7_15 [Faunusvirus sp.]
MTYYTTGTYPGYTTVTGIGYDTIYGTTGTTGATIVGGGITSGGTITMTGGVNTCNGGTVTMSNAVVDGKLTVKDLHINGKVTFGENTTDKNTTDEPDKASHDKNDNSLMTIYKSLYSSNTGDIIIELADDDIRLHSPILSQSSFFAALFISGMKDATEKKVDCTTHNADMMRQFFRWLYYRELYQFPEDKYDDWFDLLNITHFYDCLELQVYVTTNILKRITDGNIADITALCERYPAVSETIKTQCLDNFADKLIASHYFKRQAAKLPNIFKKLSGNLYHEIIDFMLKEK